MLSNLELALAASGGRFSDATPLGAGGSGLVFSVYDQKRGERVALKLLREVTARSVRQLKSEFRSVAQIFHPNLVVLHELFAAGGQWYFTMQCVEGSHIVPASMGLASQSGERSLRHEMVQLASAILAVHESGFVHRDIKPSNVLVGKDHHVTLLDFGLLRSAAAIPKTFGGLSGSPAYVAPEQILGGPIGPSADWYGYGSILYELLTGRTPFPFPAAEVLSRKLREDPVPIGTLRPDLPVDLRELCTDLLSRRPEERPTGSQIVTRLAAEGSEPTRASFAPGSHPPLPHVVGRSTEVQKAESILESALQHPLLLLFDGPSGIGKTTVAEAVLRRAKERGAIVLTSRCHPLESVPFNGWDGIIDDLAELIGDEELGLRGLVDHELAEIFPVLADEEVDGSEQLSGLADPVQRRRTAVVSLGKLLMRVARHAELFLFFDDLHWADRDSLWLLQDLLFEEDRVSFRAIATARRGDFPHSPLEAFARSGPLQKLLRSIPLEPLEQSDARALLEYLPVGALRHLDVMAEQAAGDPYLLQELAREWTSNAQVDFDGAPTVVSLVEHRLEKLSPEERTVLDVLALFGRPVPMAVATAVAGAKLSPTEVLAPLRAGGFVRVTWGGDLPQLEASHHRVLDAVAQRLDQERRVGLCGRLVDALLEQAEPDPEGIATCAAGAGRTSLAVEWARTTALEARRSLAFARAMRWFDRVLEWQAPAGRERRELLIQIAEMAEAAGDGARAAQSYGEALELTPVPSESRSPSASEVGLRIELQRRAVHGFMMIGKNDSAERMLRALLTSIGYRLPDSNWSLFPRLATARLGLKHRGLRPSKSHATDEGWFLDALDIAAVCYLHLDPMKAWLITTWQLRAALDAGDDRRLLHALSNELIFASGEGKPRITWSSQVLAAGEELFARVEDDRAKAWFDYARSLHGILLGDFGASARFAEAAERRLTTRCRGVHWELENLRRSYVGAIQLDGDMVAPELDLRHWLAAAEERGDAEGAAAHLIGLAYAACCHDRGEEALAMVHRARELVIDPEGDLTVNIDWGEAFVLCYLPPDPKALSDSYTRMRSLRKRPQRFIQMFRIWANGYASRIAALLALVAPPRDRARWIKALRDERRALARENTPMAEYLEVQAAAYLAFLAGDQDGAVRLLLKSVEVPDHGLRLFASASRFAAAAFTGDRDARDRAERELRAFHVENIEPMVRAHVALPVPFD